MADDIDARWQDEITCPHCGWKDHEHTDYPRSLRYDGDRTTVTCGDELCGKDFTVTLSVTYEYSSTRGNAHD